MSVLVFQSKKGNSLENVWVTSNIQIMSVTIRSLPPLQNRHFQVFNYISTSTQIFFFAVRRIKHKKKIYSFRMIFFFISYTNIRLKYFIFHTFDFGKKKFKKHKIVSKQFCFVSIFKKLKALKKIACITKTCRQTEH